MVKGIKLGCFQEAHKLFVDILPDELKTKLDLGYHKCTGELISYIESTGSVCPCESNEIGHEAFEGKLRRSHTAAQGSNKAGNKSRPFHTVIRLHLISYHLAFSVFYLTFFFMEQKVKVKYHHIVIIITITYRIRHV
jgi:hypothetical protein